MTIEQERIMDFMVYTMGYNLVFIDNKYYIFTQFIHSSDDTHKHYLVGKDITDMISDHSLLPNQSANTDTLSTLIGDKLENKKRVKREFHPNYAWTTWVEG